MEGYLQRADLPLFLKPSGSAVLYTNVDLSKKNKYKNENYKYHQYYENLSNNINSSGSKSTFFPDDSFPYYKSHKVYRPIEKPTTEHGSTKRAFQSFDSFVDFPTLFADNPPRGMSYQTAVDMPDGIYTFNGLETLTSNEHRQMMEKITNNFTIPPENIKMVCDYNLPMPIDKEKIESMGLRVSTSVKKYLPDSKSFRYVADMADVVNNEVDSDATDGVVGDADESYFEDDGSHPFNNYNIHGMLNKHVENEGKKNGSNLMRGHINTAALKATLSKKAKSESNSSSILNHLPKPMICSAATKLSDRYFLMYGGLEIETTIRHPDPQHCVITKKLRPNDQFWLFDTFACKFREIKISVHPTYSSIFPNSIPRFGHAIICSQYVSFKGSTNSNYTPTQNVDTTGTNRKTFKEPATIYVMGGYQLSNCENSFVAMNDLWKCDFFLDSHDTADEAIASPIGDFTMVNGINSYIINKEGEILENQPDNLKFKGVLNHTLKSKPWPRPRGFFPMELIDEDFLAEYVSWRKGPAESVISGDVADIEKQRIHSPVPTVKTKLNFNFSLSNSTSKPSLEREIVRKTISRSSDYTQSSGSSTDLTNSFSPTSDSGTNNSTLGTSKQKVLIMFGGSTTIYTKYVDDDNGASNIFYTHDILSDMWIFDFKTEQWYELSALVDIQPKLPICGHSMLFTNTSIKVICGIEKCHYDEEFYKPIQVGVNHTEKQEIDAINGKACVWKFMRETYSQMDNVKGALSSGFNAADKVAKEYNSYFLYNFDFKGFRWRVVKLALVRNLDYFAPWEYHEGSRILPGVVITESVALNDVDHLDRPYDEKTEMELRSRIKDHALVITNGPIFFKDNKLIMFSPDLKMLDINTKKYLPGVQNLIGNSISEIFSSYF